MNNIIDNYLLEEARMGAFFRKARNTNCLIGYKIDLSDGGEKTFSNIKLIHSDPEKQKKANDLTDEIKNEILKLYPLLKK